jgi:hypothetical protein
MRKVYLYLAIGLNVSGVGQIQIAHVLAIRDSLPEHMAATILQTLI